MRLLLSLSFPQEFKENNQQMIASEIDKFKKLQSPQLISELKWKDHKLS